MGIWLTCYGTDRTGLIDCKPGVVRSLHQLLELLVRDDRHPIIRQWQGKMVLVAMNSGQMRARLVLKVPFRDGSCLVDCLQPERGQVVFGGELSLELNPYEGRVLYMRGE